MTNLFDVIPTIFPDGIVNYQGVNRVEVIGVGGRLLTEYGISDVDVSFQDKGKTLKVFLNYVVAAK
jgi:hypothetical protein